VQGNWANRGEVGSQRLPQDQVIGQGANARVPKLPVKWGQAGVNPSASAAGFGRFVTTRGGEYFFTPSISFLLNLA
jgi:hypothetical protein